jgi:hypothetical protein
MTFCDEIVQIWGFTEHIKRLIASFEVWAFSYNEENEVSIVS